MARSAGRYLAGLCAAGAFAVLCLPISNPDIYWHLSAARWMAEHFAWPHADWLSHTMAGAPWSDFEWLTQLIWLAAFSAGGFAGLWLLKVAAYGACAYVLWRLLGLYAASAELRGLAVFIWALAISPANDLRPENFSVLAFLGLLYALEARRLGRLKSASGRRGLAAVAVFFALWANLHAGFIYGLILLGIYAAFELGRRKRELAAGWAAAALAALVNPYGVAVYGVFWEHWSALPVLEKHIREWQEASLVQRWLWPFWAVLAASFAAVLGRYVKRRDVPLEHVAALCLFGLSASAHVRTGVYFVALAIPAAAAALLPGLLARRPAARRGLYAAFFVAAWAFFAAYIAPPLSRGEIRRTAYIPQRLTSFLHSERAVLGRLKLLNPWHWGGYLGYELHPDYRVFVDGRYIFHHLLEPMDEARRTPERYAAFLDAHGIEAAAVLRTRQLMPMRFGTPDGGNVLLLRPFYLFYLPKRDWALVYWDEQGLVFVKRAAVPAAWLREREYRYFRPGDHEAVIRLVREGHISAGQVAAEVERHFAGRGEPGAAVEVERWLSGDGPA
ncbi:MAG: hypothetical protein ABIJ96_05210 [Elusimicrobiota bacterium]